MKAEIILDWEYGSPKQEGLYYTAIKHGENAGFQEFITWEQNSWQLPNGGQVVAFISIESLNQQLNIQWPKDKPSPSSATQDFEEV